MEELKARILEIVEDYEKGISVLDNDMAQAGIDPKSDFVNTIEQLLEERECRARKEALQRVLILEDADVNQEGEMTGLGTVHIDAILYEFEQDMKCWKKLSKLTTK